MTTEKAPLSQSLLQRVATHLLWAGVAATLISFYGFYEWYTDRPHTANMPRYSLLHWLNRSWNESLYSNSWLVVLVMALYAIRATRRMRNEPLTGVRAASLWLLAGFFLWFLSIRVSQPQIAVVSLPLIIMGSVHFTCGWARARHAVVPLALFAFIIPATGIQRLAYEFGEHSASLAHSVHDLFSESPSTNSDVRGWHFGLGCDAAYVQFPILLFAGFVYAMEVHHTTGGRTFILALSPLLVFLTHTIQTIMQFSKSSDGWSVDWLSRGSLSTQLIYFLILLVLLSLFWKGLRTALHRRPIAAA